MQHYGLTGQTVVAVTSGANMNFDRLRLVAGEGLGRVCNAGRVHRGRTDLQSNSRLSRSCSLALDLRSCSGAFLARRPG